jgi:hypothetical protein
MKEKVKLYFFGLVKVLVNLSHPPPLIPPTKGEGNYPFSLGGKRLGIGGFFRLLIHNLDFTSKNSLN